MAFLDAAPPSSARGRPRELQDPLNFYVYPSARRAAGAGCCCPTGISPNAVSVGGLRLLPRGDLVLPRMAGARGPRRRLRLHAALARRRRRRRRSRPDDRHAPRRPASWSTASATISATSSCISPSPSGSTTRSAAGPGRWRWRAGASHVVQTNHAETQRRLYLWRAYGAPWLRTARDSGRRRVPAGELVHPLFRLLGGRLCLAVRADERRAPTRSTRRSPPRRTIQPRSSGSAPASAGLCAPSLVAAEMRSAPTPRP